MNFKGKLKILPLSSTVRAISSGCTASINRNMTQSKILQSVTPM